MTIYIHWDCSGINSVSWIHWVLGLTTWPAPRWQAGMINPRLSSHQQWPTDHVFFFNSHLGTLSAASVMVLMAQIFPAPVIRKCVCVCVIPTTHFHWMAASSPPLTSALIQKVLLNCLPSLVCVLHAILPGHCWFYYDYCFVASDRIMISGHCAVTVMCARNLSCLPRSTNSCQSCAVNPVEDQRQTLTASALSTCSCLQW